MKMLLSCAALLICLYCSANADEYRVNSKELCDQLPLCIYVSPSDKDTIYITLVYREIAPFNESCNVHVPLREGNDSVVFQGIISSREHYLGGNLRSCTFRLNNGYIEDSLIEFATDWSPLGPSYSPRLLPDEGMLRISVSVRDLSEWYKSFSDVRPAEKLQDDARLLNLSNMKEMSFSQWVAFRDLSKVSAGRVRVPE